MPPKRPQHQEPETESEEDMDMMGGIDLARFTNPNYAREFKAKLPAKIRERVQALEALDEQYKKLKLEMSNEVDAAEREYHKAIAPLCAERARIVRGDQEPTDAQVKEGFPDEHKEEGVIIDGAVNTTASKGLPNFWLDALKHHVIISEFISDRDEEALKFVTDVSCSTEEGEKQVFTITFDFAANPFFSNASLSKTFTLERQEDDMVLSKATGTKIEWKDGKNLGVKTVTKKIKSKAKKGQTKFVTSEEPCPTFFDFFGEDEDEEEEWMALAETLQEKIIPFATDYYTGDAPNGESDLEDEDMDEEEEEEEEEEEIPVPTRGGRGGYSAGGQRGGGGAGGRGGARGGAQGQQDCKQQ